jgi:arylsulfatase A-like enzyme
MTIRYFFAAVALAFATLLALQCGSETEPPRPDVLLITIDTLRADALGTYGASDTLTPNIDQLAHDGVVYEAATTPMPLTRPAHASIMTGLYPDQHGVLTNHQILPERTVTLAETLQQVGYQTAGFTGVRFLNQKSGLSQGFDAFDAPTRKRTPRAKEVVDRAVSWLRGADPESPLLLWVHVYDPHQPYNPLRTFRRDIDPELEQQIPIIRWKALNRVAKENHFDVPAEVYELARDYYRSEVEYSDFWVGRLLKNFDRMRATRRSLVILAADHGECFENGFYFEHADCLNEGALQVPLIVRYPERLGSGTRVSRRVSNLDITPTVLRELSIQNPDGIPGQPLQPGLGEDQGRLVLVRPPEVGNPNRKPHRLRIIRTVVGDPVLPATDPRTRGIVDLRWKFLLTPDSEKLFRLPDERLNRIATERETGNRMKTALAAEISRYPAGEVAQEDRDPETLEALETLGYIQ